MRGQYYFPKYMKKGDNYEAEVNFQAGSGMLRDIQLGYIPVKIIKVDSEMAEGLRVTFKKNNNIFEW